MAAMNTFITVAILRVPDLGLQSTALMLNNWFLIFPQFNFAMGLFDLYFNTNILKVCEEKEILCEAELVPFNR